jgi:hexosaminidase
MIKFFTGIFLVVLCLSTCSEYTHAHDKTNQSETRLGIVPTPQFVKSINGHFSINAETRILISEDAPEEIRFAARDFQKAVQEILNIQLKFVNSTLAENNSNIIAIGNPATNPVVSSMMNKYGLKLNQKMEDEGYVLGIGNDGIVIGAANGPGLLYGTMSLRQLLRIPANQKKIPAVVIHDWPYMKMRGIQDEFSYGQVSTMENFKDIIRFLAEYKMNTDFYYFEDTFKFKKYPFVGKGRGAMTPEQARELQDFAKPYNVQIIPIFEMLGNQGAFLMLDEVRHLAEYPGAHSFSVKDDSFEFLENCFHELADAFDSPYFHAGLDESWDLGFGQSEKEVVRDGRGETHAKHYKRVNDLLKSRGKKMIMYADIILERPEILGMIPKDIILMDWHYDPAQHYPSVPKLAKHGFPLMVLPGMNNWDRIFPTLSAAMINIKNFTLDGIQHNALGSFTSTWGDNGSKNLRELLYYGYAYGSEVTWSPQTTDTGNFSKRFCNQFYGPGTSSELEAIFSLLENWPKEWWLPMPTYFRHPFLPRKNDRPHAEQELYRVGENARLAIELIHNLRPKIQKRKGDLDYLEYCAKSHLHYVNSQRLVRDLQQFKPASQTPEQLKASQKRFLKRIAEIRNQSVELKQIFNELWLRTNIKANLHYALNDYDRMTKTWDEATQRAKNGIYSYDPRPPAQWIYHPASFTKNKNGKNNKVQHAWFRKTINIESSQLSKADIQIHGDTHLKIYVNGKPVGEQFARRNFSAPVSPQLVQIYDIKSYLKPGQNVIAVDAHNYGTTQLGLEPGGPHRSGGFHFWGEIQLDGKKPISIGSDSGWKVSDQKTDNWNHASFDDSGWVQAKGDTKPTVWVTYPDFPNHFKGFSNRR